MMLHFTVILISTLLSTAISLLYFLNDFALFRGRKYLLIFSILTLKIILFVIFSSKFGFSYDLVSYAEHGALILKGKVPSLDFLTPYSIGFEYLIALFMLCIPNPLAIGIGFIIIESLIYICLFSIDKNKGEKIVYLLAFNPVVFHFTVFDIQDEIILCLFLTSSLFLLQKEKHSIWTITTSILFLFITKFLALLLIQPIFLKKLKEGFFVALVLSGLYGTLIYFNFNPFTLEFERLNSKDTILNIITTGNIFWILNEFKANYLSKYATISMILALLYINLRYLKHIFYHHVTSQNYFLPMCSINFLILMTFNKMSFPYYYLVPIFSIIIYEVSIKNQVSLKEHLGFSILCFFISINHQFEFMLNQFSLKSTYIYYLFFIIQCMIVFSNLYILKRYDNEVKKILVSD